MYLEWKAKDQSLGQISIRRIESCAVIKICCFPCYISNYIFQVDRRSGVLNLTWETFQEFCENQWKQLVSLCGVQEWHNFEILFYGNNTKKRATEVLIIIGSKSVVTDKPKLMRLNWCNSQSVVMSFTAENTFTWYTVNTWMDSLPYPGRLDHVFVVVLLLSFVQFSTLHRKTRLKTFFPPSPCCLHFQTKKVISSQIFLWKASFSSPLPPNKKLWSEYKQIH